MVQLINHNASRGFEQRVRRYWHDTPMPVVRRYESLGWKAAVHRLPPSGHGMPEACLDPMAKTIHYYERRPASLFSFRSTTRGSCSELTHYHELGHFLDFTNPGGRLSQSDDFIAALKVDLSNLTSVQRDKYINLLAPRMMVPDPVAFMRQTDEQREADHRQASRQEILAETFAHNALTIADGIARDFPTVSPVVYNRTRPWLLGR